MLATNDRVELLLESAIRAAQGRGDEVQRAIEAIPLPIYLADCNGGITAYNSACVEFAGRTPDPEQDRWCVSWRLYTLDGEVLPHDQCPMAIAIRERRTIRDLEAIAERPDGTRIQFRPHPTPLYDADGVFTGAVNVLIDVTDMRKAETLRIQAARCRRLVTLLSNRQAIDALSSMADDYEAEAQRMVSLQ